MASIVRPQNPTPTPNPNQNVAESMATVDKSKYISLPQMTKFEFDQLIGLRTIALSLDDVPFVDVPPDFRIKSNIELRKIAIQELLEKKLPYTIERPMPDKTVEIWNVEDLSLDAIRHMIR